MGIASLHPSYATGLPAKSHGALLLAHESISKTKVTGGVSSRGALWFNVNSTGIGIWEQLFRGVLLNYGLNQSCVIDDGSGVC